MMNQTYSPNFVAEAGQVKPFGAHLTQDGVNFSLFAKTATHVSLCLFDISNREPIGIFTLDPEVNRTGDVWHILVKGLPEKFLYTYRLAKKKGRIYSRFYHEENLVIDPYATAIVSKDEWGRCDEPYHPKGLFSQESSFDWEGDRPLDIPHNQLILYEMHVRGFTVDGSSGTHHPGTFLGVIEKIPHLCELGINAVNLMPVQEFNECEYHRFNPLTGQRLLNYWGYSTVNFFSPMARMSCCNAIQEFKAMVKALHKNGIEVILDIVFNHTAEGNEEGPIYSFKGIAPNTYYLFDREKHLNFTGCGNTMNCNHPIVRQYIRDCLHYWVTEMHVDGFRFDLAAIFTRGAHGEPLQNAPLVEELSQDPILAKTKLIAEPWDAGGLYSLGAFYPKMERWSEWNDQYRDNVRRFIKGDKGAKREFAKRICGSEETFYGRSPLSSINFLTAHDGFTLADLVSYNEKHNTQNGEESRDGHSANYSWNMGVEGRTDSDEVVILRERQMRNFHLALMVSQGIPMLLMGDEYGHTREGNNNTWCQDNNLNWFLWDKLANCLPFFRYYKGLIQLRKRYSAFNLGRFLTDEDIEWHGLKPGDPDWDGKSRLLAFTLKEGGVAFYAAFSPEGYEVEVELPHAPYQSGWQKLVDTGSSPPEDFYEEESAPYLDTLTLQMKPYSASLLLSKHSA